MSPKLNLYGVSIGSIVGLWTIGDRLYVLSWFSWIQLFVTLWTIACQVALSTGFSRQEYCSGLPCPPPGDLPHPGITSPALQADSLLLSHGGSPEIGYGVWKKKKKESVPESHLALVRHVTEQLWASTAWTGACGVINLYLSIIMKGKGSTSGNYNYYRALNRNFWRS